MKSRHAQGSGVHQVKLVKCPTNDPFSMQSNFDIRELLSPRTSLAFQNHSFAIKESPRSQGSEYKESPRSQGSATLHQDSEIKESPRSEGGPIPVWRKDPEPLADWTPEQQRILINQLDEHPSHRRHPDHLRRVISKTHQLMPDKSIQEIQLCYRHLQSKRIAYFGKDAKQSSLSPR